MKYDEVKPCPLCGGIAKLERKSKTYINQTLRYVTYVRCCQCDTRGPRVLIGANSEFARDIAIKRWNRRVYEDNE
jgi:Lar family restriction alleviation protein